MGLLIVLGVVVTLAAIVIGVLFFMLSQEGKKVEEKAVPVTDIQELNKKLSSKLFEQNENKVIEKGSEVIPVFSPKVGLPVQEVQISPEDEAYKKKALELEGELRAISQKADGQSEEAKQMIKALMLENDSLKSRQAELEEAQQKLDEIQKEASQLKFDNMGLQSQLETANAKVHLLEEEMASFKFQMTEEISRANQTVAQLREEKEQLMSAPKPEPDNSLRQERDALKLENDSLKIRQVGLEEDLQKFDEIQREVSQLKFENIGLKSQLETINAVVAQLSEEKEKLLAIPKHEPDDNLRHELEILISEYNLLKQKYEDLEKINQQLEYEQIKARAQSSGLERVSFNYKNQLEDFLKKVSAAELANQQLSQIKNRLEGMVEEVKTQNEELVRKEHLAQFEIEKNRTRLASLERENQDLKAKAGM